MRELSSRWKELGSDDADRVKFETLAADDKARFERESAAKDLEVTQCAVVVDRGCSRGKRHGTRADNQGCTTGQLTDEAPTTTTAVRVGARKPVSPPWLEGARVVEACARPALASRCSGTRS